ncbi:homogentisate 1,2-dioxygenase [Chengkuizengella axinellae]|uniref:Homogentisate 1,2-dioxygenase n=1 Tax=Chengkuizengella axinellae TaxID=3064388 RepID=A0ABT9J6V5_9BACL|nr:homogentisate 1,2-dioxygenase [Chengkuizengella sp. 2205SS18-9]MDP5276750.1 homogentisate 1,2-dioxygenase [Chengkuizengella sp. 2205SS18-9]
MHYRKMGSIPKKRHIQFKKEDNTLFREQVMGTKGFSGTQSILYHYNMPTSVKGTKMYPLEKMKYEEDIPLKHRHLLTGKCESGKDAILGRKYMLGNDDLVIGIVKPLEAMDYYYRNGDGDELLFVHHGTGKIETIFGSIYYKEGDYIVIPIGTIYRVVPQTHNEQTLLIVETNSQITTPRRYRNEYGQLLEHSPFCERDIHGPEKLETYNQMGQHTVLTKSRGMMTEHTFANHPLDVVGWDGYLYPWKFNIHDFEPITGRIHQPPPVHQTFEGHNFVICSFVPRLYDYHPDAIPAPYYHSNVNSDEVIYYVDGNFMSRNGISEGSITLHPSGIPHGPHPGKIEASIGKKETAELAVMIDTFKPLKIVSEAALIEDHSYMSSWT